MAPLVEVADIDHPSKGAVIKRCHTLPGLDDPLDTYPRRALPIDIICPLSAASRSF